MNTFALYFCHFPPLNLGGVGLLMEYLLAELSAGPADSSHRFTLRYGRAEWRP